MSAQRVTETDLLTFRDRTGRLDHHVRILGPHASVQESVAMVICSGEATDDQDVGLEIGRYMRRDEVEHQAWT